jgi:hypothetical protein
MFSPTPTGKSRNGDILSEEHFENFKTSRGSSSFVIFKKFEFYLVAHSL